MLDVMTMQSEYRRVMDLDILVLEESIARPQLLALEILVMILP